MLLAPCFSTVHSRQFFAAVDDFGFLRGEFVEAGHHDFCRREVLREARLGGVVAGFGLEQTGVERGKFLILHMFRQCVETFA